MCMVEDGSRAKYIPVLLMVAMIVLNIPVAKVTVLEIVQRKYLLLAISKVVAHTVLVDHILVAQVIIVVAVTADIAVTIVEETVAENAVAYVRTDAVREMEYKEKTWKLSPTQTNDYLQLWGARIISHQ